MLPNLDYYFCENDFYNHEDNIKNDIKDKETLIITNYKKDDDIPNCFDNNSELFRTNNNLFCEEEIFWNDKNFYAQYDGELNNNNAKEKGKLLNSINPTISNVMNNLFQTDKIDYNTKQDMQLFKKKKRRRTKKEIEKEKALKPTNIKVNLKSRGRMRKTDKKRLDIQHSKMADDNILKKIHSNFIKSIRKWLNSSFIDEKGNFIPEYKYQFLKISSIIIGNNLKKLKVMKLMNMTFKEIFSVEISNKYKRINKDFNKKLIEEIYKENKQIYVIFILDLTFIEALHIFNRQKRIIDFENIIKQRNLNEDKINEFFGKFEKIDCFLEEIYEKEKKTNESEFLLQDYIQRISILCVNYETWFERKFIRNNKIKDK
jgi:hypothetical protein